MSKNLKGMFTDLPLELVLFDVLIARKDCNNASSFSLLQEVRIEALMMKLVEHHALFEILDRTVSVRVRIDTCFQKRLHVTYLGRGLLSHLHLAGLEQLRRGDGRESLLPYRVLLLD